MRAQPPIFALVFLAVGAWGQLPGPPSGGRVGPPPTPKAGALIDLTGYWVSVGPEELRFRMFTPPKGDFAGIPLNADGTKLANAWDPATDEASGEQCKAYGAPAIMGQRRHTEDRNRSRHADAFATFQCGAASDGGAFLARLFRGCLGPYA